MHTLEGEKELAFMNYFGGGRDSPLHPPVDETLINELCSQFCIILQTSKIVEFAVANIMNSTKTLSQRVGM